MGTPALLRVLDDARHSGYLGPAPVEHQLAHSERVAGLLGTFVGSFLDLGSGGGLPGLALAGCWPEANGVLLDSQEKRCEFLEESVIRLGLADRIRVRCGRAEALARDPALRGQFELVVARGFGPPAVTAECGVGFLRTEGRLVVTEPPESETRTTGVRWDSGGLEQLGLRAPEFLRDGESGIAVLRAAADPTQAWPRRTGLPGKRPLWR